MKLNQRTLKKIIYEVLNEQLEVPGDEAEVAPAATAVPQTSREKSVERGLGTGGVMKPEEYSNLLGGLLKNPKATLQVQKAGIQILFGDKGAQVASVLLPLIQQLQKGPVQERRRVKRRRK